MSVIFMDFSIEKKYLLTLIDQKLLILLFSLKLLMFLRVYVV